MPINIPRRQIIGGLLVAVLFARDDRAWLVAPVTRG